MLRAFLSTTPSSVHAPRISKNLTRELVSAKRLLERGKSTDLKKMKSLVRKGEENEISSRVAAYGVVLALKMVFYY